jgi:hypothetical protein
MRKDKGKYCTNEEVSSRSTTARSEPPKQPTVDGAAQYPVAAGRQPHLWRHVGSIQYPGRLEQLDPGYGGMLSL